MVSKDNPMLAALLDALAEEGQKIIEEAYRTSDYTDRSYNMRDAYGYAVYYNGEIVRKGDLGEEMAEDYHKGWEKYDIPANNGRTYLHQFFLDYKPKTILALVCVNTVYYASIIQDGTQGGKEPNKYQVISQVDYMMDDLAREIKGSRVIEIAP